MQSDHHACQWTTITHQQKLPRAKNNKKMRFSRQVRLTQTLKTTSIKKLFFDKKMNSQNNKDYQFLTQIVFIGGLNEFTLQESR